MQRRGFIGLIGGAAAWPLAAGAQQKPVPVIGFLSPGPPGAGGPLLDGFRLGLNEAGYSEGQTVPQTVGAGVGARSRGQSDCAAHQPQQSVARGFFPIRRHAGSGALQGGTASHREGHV